MDEKEEGEITSDGNEDSFGLSYKPVVRPDAEQYRQRTRHVPSSDEDYSSDSDSDAPVAAKRKRPQISKMDAADSQSQDTKSWAATRGAKRRNNIWSTVMEEQVLSQVIGDFGIKKRLPQGDRSVESYDYTQALKMRGIQVDDSDEEEEEETKQKRMARKRHVKERINHPKGKTKSDQRVLVDVEVQEGMTDEDLALVIASALFERKPELIVRVVEVLGREKALQLYRKTQQVELEGGLMIMNGTRRRTSGGVYLNLLKSNPDIEKADLAKIFIEEEQGESQQWRKRKRAHRKRERHESKPQGETGSEEMLHLGGLFSDDPGGAKCPGSTPVTSPQPSDKEEEDDLAGSVINQLSPHHLPDLVAATSPPVTAEPKVPHPDMSLETYKGGFLNIEAGECGGAKAGARTTEAYDDDFLDIHTCEEMELF